VRGEAGETEEGRRHPDTRPQDAEGREGEDIGGKQEGRESERERERERIVTRGGRERGQAQERGCRDRNRHRSCRALVHKPRERRATAFENEAMHGKDARETSLISFFFIFSPALFQF